jgi:hypothetical protein
MIRDLLWALVVFPLKIAVVLLGAYAGALVFLAAATVVFSSSCGQWLWEHGVSTKDSGVLPFMAFAWIPFATVGAFGGLKVSTLAAERFGRRKAAEVPNEM